MATIVVRNMIWGVAAVLILGPFGGALKVDGDWPCLGIAIMCALQSWREADALKRSPSQAG